MSDTLITRNRLIAKISEIFNDVNTLVKQKSVAYNDNDDALGEIDTTAESLGITPSVYLLALMAKHMNVIRKSAMKPSCLTEEDLSRIKDCIVYLGIVHVVFEMELDRDEQMEDGSDG